MSSFTATITDNKLEIFQTLTVYGMPLWRMIHRFGGRTRMDQGNMLIRHVTPSALERA